MSAPVPMLRLCIPSDLRFVPIVHDFMSSVCQAARLERTAASAVVMATNEAISNVIRHAHCDRPSALIHLECRLGERGIEISVLDEGEPFDLAGVPVLDPSQVRLGGRGVFIMRALMDELHCRPRPERGNALRMVKHCRRTVDAHVVPNSA